MVNSQFVYAQVLRAALAGTHTWLDLGCGHQFLPEWLPEDSRRLYIEGCRTIGVDADAAALARHTGLQLRIGGSVESLPLVASSVDLATANMVVEHVERPELLFREVSRVLKPGGVFLVHTPNAQGYTTMLTRCVPEVLRPRLAGLLQGREARDVYPTFYRANRLADLGELARRAGLRVQCLRTVSSSVQLYQVPILRAAERALLRNLERESLALLRPCIIAEFVKPSVEDKHPSAA